MVNNLENIFNFLPVSERVATAGQPTQDQYAAIQAAGYGVVINLALPTSDNALPNEAALAQSLNLRYISIPVIWEKPTLKDFAQFSQVMQDHAASYIFVHCAANKRVSVFMYLYQRIYNGLSQKQAQDALYKIWQPNETWQTFINLVLQHYQVPEA